MHEDMVKASVFYGWKFLPERAKNNVIDKFRDSGFVKYVSERIYMVDSSKGKRQELGQPTSDGKTRNTMISDLATYIYTNLGYIEKYDGYRRNLFISQMKDWIVFEPDEWEPYDQTVSSMLCTGARVHKKITTKPQKKILSLGFHKINRK